MKLIHTADLHIGKSVNGFSLLDDQRYILAQILRIARENEVDALLISGDIYDKTAPSAEAVAVLDWFLTKANEDGLVVFAIPGNHDSAERVAYASGILERHGVYLPEIYQGQVKTHALEDEYGKLNFWLLPFLKPVHVRPHFPEEEINQNYSLAIKAALSTCKLNPEERNVLLAHQFVVGGGVMPITCDSELNVGGLDSVDASVFDAFDYVALGHIHRAQRAGREEVRYAGSPLKYSFSEIDHVKSISLITCAEKGSLEIDVIPLKPLRDLRCIRGPLAELCSPEVVKAQDAEDYLRIVLTDESPQLNALSSLRAHYPNLMAIEYDNALTRSASSPAYSHEEGGMEDPLDLFEAFYRKQNGIELSEGQQALASKVMNDVRASILEA